MGSPFISSRGTSCANLTAHATDACSGRCLTPSSPQRRCLGALGLERDAKAAEIFGRSWLRLRDQTAAAAPLHRFVVTRSARAQREAERLMPMGIIVEGNLKLIETFEDSLLEMYDPVNEPREDIDRFP